MRNEAHQSLEFRAQLLGQYAEEGKTHRPTAKIRPRTPNHSFPAVPRDVRTPHGHGSARTHVPSRTWERPPKGEIWQKPRGVAQHPHKDRVNHPSTADPVLGHKILADPRPKHRVFRSGGPCPRASVQTRLVCVGLAQRLLQETIPEQRTLSSGTKILADPLQKHKMLQSGGPCPRASGADLPGMD